MKGRGAVYLRDYESGVVEVECSDVAGQFLDTFYLCRNLIDDVDALENGPSYFQNKFVHEDKKLLQDLKVVEFDLMAGDYEKAKRRLSKMKSDSQMLTALRMWAARISGDFEDVMQMSKMMRSDACGRAGAIAQHQLGLAFAQHGGGDAVSRFKRAVELDPEYVPAYLSMGRMLLANGTDPHDVAAEILKLLSGAPRTKEITKFRKRIGALEFD